MLKSLFRLFSTAVRNLDETAMPRILNVAEKNDAAKNIAEILSGGRYRRRDGQSKYNKIYEFDYMVHGQQSTMLMTSVSGHLLDLDFPGVYRKWKAFDPILLFEAPTEMNCLPNYQDIKATLEKEIRSCNMLIIWTDCDREGENIGFEIMQVCSKVKPNIQTFRAKFSEITKQSITRALNTLGMPNKHVSDAVNVRRELDLRIGAAFTRFQSLQLWQVFPNAGLNIISYGSCQFPTLGFVVERYKQIENFIPEPFWKLRVVHKVEEDEVLFLWKRERLFDKTACQILYDICLEKPLATVVDVQSKPKTKWRPLPLDTVELEKLASRKLHIPAKETMQIAERLYTMGLISYPRTETNIFPVSLDLVPLVEMQSQSLLWGEFAQRVLVEGPNPKKGKKTDEAHPPIHPIKYADNLQGREKQVYEFVVRHFLACVSKDAEGFETIVEIDIAKERFTATGLMIIAKNYLEVYIYDKWNDKNIPVYNIGDEFEPTQIEMNESTTEPPPLLTEADLIALMEKHGIGTDATHADHIEKIKTREYVGVQNERFLPGKLGMGLVEGYDSMGFEMSKPFLRAELEADLKSICDGAKDSKAVLKKQIDKYRAVFVETVAQVNKLSQTVAHYLEVQAEEIETREIQDNPFKPVMPCPKCGSNMILSKSEKHEKYFVGCMRFPECKHSLWFPTSTKEIKICDEFCELCHPRQVCKLEFTFGPSSMPPTYTRTHTGCIGGCNPYFLQDLGINSTTMTHSNQNLRNDSGSQSTSSNHRSASLMLVQPALNSRNAQTPRPVQPCLPNRQMPPQRLPTDGAQLAGNAVACNCQEDAILLTVRKEGPNQGRQFYKCGKRDNQCNFFLWAATEEDSNFNNAGPSSINTWQQPEPNRWQTKKKPTTNPSRAQNGATEDIQCTCGLLAKRLTVQKDGPNKGRIFYACQKPQQSQCKFFLWADDNNGNEVAQNNFNISDRNLGLRNSTAKRKCGVCRQEGHNKKNCPSNK